MSIKQQDELRFLPDKSVDSACFATSQFVDLSSTCSCVLEPSNSQPMMISIPMEKPTIESVVCPYVKWIRLLLFALSYFMPMIPTADDMFELRTTWEPKTVSNLSNARSSQLLTHEILVNAISHTSHLILVIVHSINGFSGNHGMSHLLPGACPDNISACSHPTAVALRTRTSRRNNHPVIIHLDPGANPDQRGRPNSSLELHPDTTGTATSRDPAPFIHGDRANSIRDQILLDF
jgi:hypothetical protein